MTSVGEQFSAWLQARLHPFILSMEQPGLVKCIPVHGLGIAAKECLPAQTILWFYGIVWEETWLPQTLWSDQTESSGLQSAKIPDSVPDSLSEKHWGTQCSQCLVQQSFKQNIMRESKSSLFLVNKETLVRGSGGDSSQLPNRINKGVEFLWQNRIFVWFFIWRGKLCIFIFFFLNLVFWVVIRNDDFSYHRAMS